MYHDEIQTANPSHRNRHFLFDQVQCITDVTNSA